MKVFTDGSMGYPNLSVLDVLLSERRVRAAAVASTGVVFLGTERRGTKALRLITRAGLMTKITPFIAEAIGPVFSTRLLECTNLPIDGGSDCKAVLSAMKAARFGALAKIKRPELFYSAKGASHINWEWVRSHPERRKPKEEASWTRNDWGIRIADAVAGGNDKVLADATNGYVLHEIETATILPAIMKEGQWYWSENSTGALMTDSLADWHADASLSKYLAARDKNRTVRGLLPMCSKANTSLLRYVYPVAKTIRHRKRDCLTAWDKSYTNGRNRAKLLGEDDVASLCGQCGAKDSLHHMCLQCPHASIVQWREQAKDTQKTALSEAKEGLSENVHYMLKEIVALSWSDKSHLTEHLWRGMIPNEVTIFLNSSAMREKVTSQGTVNKLKRRVASVLRPLALAMQGMIASRGEMYDALHRFTDKGARLRQAAARRAATRTRKSLTKKAKGSEVDSVDKKGGKPHRGSARLTLCRAVQMQISLRDANGRSAMEIVRPLGMEESSVVTSQTLQGLTIVSAGLSMESSVERDRG